MMTRKSKPEYLYVHVPFCSSICYYCDFTHMVYRSDIVQKWLKALQFQLEQSEINENLRTIYIGGGTPTSLSADELDCLLTLLDPCAHSLAEYTIEINPENLTAEKAEIISRHGINRASIGMQSADNDLLKMMNRHHTVDDVRQAVDLLHSAGIFNISLDLMYSLPGQSMETLQMSLLEALKLKPYHISLYSLTIEENTVFGKRGYDHLDDDTEADMYEYLCKALQENGYDQYEVSNFCLEGCESIHNQAYWTYCDFYGIGAGASGKEGMMRYDNTGNINEYILNPLKRTEIPLTGKDAMFEMLMMSIRLKKGLDLSVFEAAFQEDFCQVYQKAVSSLIQQKLCVIRDNHFMCTEKGYPIMNTILLEFLD